MPAPTTSKPRRPRPPRRPALADLLGTFALVPFVGGAALTAWPGHAGLVEPAAHALSAYAATVLAFIGALHWGIAFTRTAPRPALLVWGVVPAIVAWLALLLHPSHGLAAQAAMLVACLLVDRSAYPREGVAHWLPLRTGLTAVAAACCFVGAWQAWR